MSCGYENGFRFDGSRCKITGRCIEPDLDVVMHLDFPSCDNDTCRLYGEEMTNIVTMFVSAIYETHSMEEQASESEDSIVQEREYSDVEDAEVLHTAVLPYCDAEPSEFHDGPVPQPLLVRCAYPCGGLISSLQVSCAFCQRVRV